jgi:hypothetical protein
MRVGVVNAARTVGVVNAARTGDHIRIHFLKSIIAPTNLLRVIE